MPCRGIYLALTDREEERLLAARGDDGVMEVIQGIEEKWDEEWLQEMDKAWDAIHRCLNGGSLVCNGKSLLEGVVLGGAQLHGGEGYIVSYLTAAEVQYLAEKLAEITQEWFREQYFAMGKKRFGVFTASNYAGPVSEQDFAYSWEYFGGARNFFGKAAEAGRAVVFMVDQ